MTRCKFRCDTKTETEHGYQLGFSAVPSGSKENESFFKWTPSADMNLSLVSKETGDKFAPGKQYYIDISEAE